MTKPPSRRAVREPVQVYLEADDSALLNRLAAETGLSKAEILRRGMRSFAREQTAGSSPMLRFLAESSPDGWPSAVARDHDAALAAEHRGTRKGRR